MKLYIRLTLLVLVMFSKIATAVDPSATVYIDHGSYISDKEYEFDIMMKASGATTAFQLRTFQAGLFLDPTWVNGGNITASNIGSWTQMASSGYNGVFQWNAIDKLVNCSVNFDVLGVNNNCIATTVSSTPIIITRVRLTNTSEFNCSSPNIKFNYVSNVTPLRLRTSFSWREVGCTTNYDMFYPGRTYNGTAVFNTETYSGSDADGKSTVTTFTNSGFCFDELTITAFVEGYYLGAGHMQSALLNGGVLHSSADQCDTIQVELHAAANPSSVLYTQKTILRTDGKIYVIIPTNLNLTSASYWIVLKLRNATETWSKTPVMLSNRTTYDFTEL